MTAIAHLTTREASDLGIHILNLKLSPLKLGILSPCFGTGNPHFAALGLNRIPHALAREQPLDIPGEPMLACTRSRKEKFNPRPVAPTIFLKLILSEVSSHDALAAVRIPVIRGVTGESKTSLYRYF